MLSITGTAPSGCLVSYPRLSLGGGSLPSAEKQLMYSTALADWVTILSLVWRKRFVVISHFILKFPATTFGECYSASDDLFPPTKRLIFCYTVEILCDWLVGWLVFVTYQPLYIFTNYSTRVGCDTRSTLKGSLTGLISEFFFNETGC